MSRETAGDRTSNPLWEVGGGGESALFSGILVPGDEDSQLPKPLDPLQNWSLKYNRCGLPKPDTSSGTAGTTVSSQGNPLASAQVAQRLDNLAPP